MVELTDKLEKYSTFLNGALKAEEKKIADRLVCKCGCTDGGICTCVRDAYKNVSTEFYQIFPEFKKEYNKN